MAGGYLIQAVIGLVLSIAFYFINSKYFYAAGLILPMGFGQSTGRRAQLGQQLRGEL